MEREKKIEEDGKIRPQTSVNLWDVVCSMPRSRIPMFSVGFGLVFFFFVQFHCPQWGFGYQLRVFRIFDWVNVLLVLYAYIGMLHLKKNVNSSRTEKIGPPEMRKFPFYQYTIIGKTKNPCFARRRREKMRC